MTLDSQYAQMVMPMPVRVWIYQLQPVTVGHYCLLSRLKANVTTDAKVPGPGDLALMLWCLSRPWKKAMMQIGSRWQTLSCRMIAWLLRNDLKLQKYVLIEFLRFWNYQNETWELWESSEGEGEERVANMQTVRWMLMSEWGYSHDEVMDMPWKLAVSDAFGCLVIKDKLKISTPESKVRRQWVEEQMRVNQNAR